VYYSTLSSRVIRKNEKTFLEERKNTKQGRTKKLFESVHGDVQVTAPQLPRPTLSLSHTLTHTHTLTHSHSHTNTHTQEGGMDGGMEGWRGGEREGEREGGMAGWRTLSRVSMEMFR
jgi:hypothetical protein